MVAASGITSKPSHLQIPGGPKMARAALRRRVICCNAAEKQGNACLLFGGFAGHLWPIQTSARRAKNGPSQMRRPDYKCLQPSPNCSVSSCLLVQILPCHCYVVIYWLQTLTICMVIYRFILSSPGFDFPLPVDAPLIFIFISKFN